MGFDLSLHRVRAMSAEASLPEASTIGLTLRIEQATTQWDRDNLVEVDVFLTDDQDAADAYMLAAAINCSVHSADTVDERRMRAAVALGWTYIVPPMVEGEPTERAYWERPWREGDPDTDNPQRAVSVLHALSRDLETI